MTVNVAKKSATLFRSTAKFTPKVARKTKEPFAISSAKYHPALKKLAGK